MSFSYLPPVDNANFFSDDEYSAASPLPSPNEFSHVIMDSDFQESKTTSINASLDTLSLLLPYTHINTSSKPSPDLNKKLNCKRKNETSFGNIFSIHDPSSEGSNLS